MILRRIAIATLVAGTLDIGSAICLTALRGKPIGRMLQNLASGPLGDWPLGQPLLGPLAGLLVHFAIMAVMAAAFALAARRLGILSARPLASGALYGILLYLVMYWIVIPLRWPPETVRVDIGTVAVPVLIHLLLVGIPIALLTRPRARVAGAAA